MILSCYRRTTAGGMGVAQILEVDRGQVGVGSAVGTQRHESHLADGIAGSGAVSVHGEPHQRAASHVVRANRCHDDSAWSARPRRTVPSGRDGQRPPSPGVWPVPSRPSDHRCVLVGLSNQTSW